MADIVFKRTGKPNPNGSVPGELTIGNENMANHRAGCQFHVCQSGHIRAAHVLEAVRPAGTLLVF